MKLIARIGAVRTALLHARDVRVAHRRLAAELAAFVTPQERAELDLMVGRHGFEETREIREILNRQDTTRQQQAFSLGGYRGR